MLVGKLAGAAFDQGRHGGLCRVAVFGVDLAEIVAQGLAGDGLGGVDAVDAGKIAVGVNAPAHQVTVPDADIAGRGQGEVEPHPVGDVLRRVLVHQGLHVTQSRLLDRCKPTLSAAGRKTAS